jgi:hypothetical protein
MLEVSDVFLLEVTNSSPVFPRAAFSAVSAA